MTLRVLVVDDTAVFRRVVSDAFASLPDVEVVGTAANGRAALERLEELKPDLVSLDIEMPEMNGVQVLQALKQRGTDVGVLVLSALTRKGGDLTLKALELGAFDFLTKPAGGSPDENRAFLASELVPRLKAFAHRREIQRILRGGAAPIALPPVPVPAAVPLPPKPPPVLPPGKPELVLLGVSTGGPTALATVLPALPAHLPVPVLVVQHMPRLFTASLASSLDAKCALRVKEAEDGEAALPGCVYIAPGGFHMKVAGDPAGAKRIQLTDDPPENHCKPAVDVLFRSAAYAFPGKAAAIVLTGMGEDGALGCRLLHRGGSRIIVQDEATCVVFGMPKEVIAAGVAHVVAPLGSIADEILKAVRGLG